MKICNYCGSENDDSAAKCISCGAAAFSYKCGNCGTVFSSGFCPNCGVKAGTRPSVCPDCGATYYTAACPRCGYSPARETAERNQSQTIVIRQEPVAATHKRRVTFGIVLLWLFFFPVMVVVSIWRAPKLSLVWKIVLTALFAGFILYSYYFSN